MRNISSYKLRDIQLQEKLKLVNICKISVSILIMFSTFSIRKFSISLRTPQSAPFNIQM